MADYAKVRLLGTLPSVSAALRALTAAEAEGFEVAEVSRAYANRRDPGFRLYAFLRFPAENDAKTSAGRRTAAKQSAAPLPPIQAKETQERTRLP